MQRVLVEKEEMLGGHSGGNSQLAKKLTEIKIISTKQ